MAMGRARLCAIQNKTICTPIASAMYVSFFFSRARVPFKRVLPVLQNLYRSDDNCKSLKPLFIGLFVAIAVVVATTMLGIVVKRRYAQPLKEAKKALVNNQVCRLGARQHPPHPSVHLSAGLVGPVAPRNDADGALVADPARAD